MKMGSLSIFLTGFILFSAVIAYAADRPSSFETRPFGKTPAGEAAHLYILTNPAGTQAALTDLGASLVWLKTADRNGKLADIVLGYDDLSGYVTDKASLGITVGRYANRIARGKFALDGKSYSLPINDPPNTLHGGFHGFGKRLWKGEPLADGSGVRFAYLSKDGEEGYPGNLTVHVTYTLTGDNRLRIDYEASSDKDTVINLTNHSYFNLAGQGVGDILGTVLTIHADRFTPVDATLIPTGSLAGVEGTPFDFNTPTAIGARIGSADEQLKLGRGYDHNFVLSDAPRPQPALAAEAFDPRSGRVLQVWTTEPGIQLYTGNFLDGSIHGKDGKVYQHRFAFCLETQHFPDSPNHPSFPTTTLKAGEHFRSETIYAFSAR
jgi:aldose 1-epimerase